MKTLLVFDDDIMKSFKSFSEIELETYKPKRGYSDFQVAMQYGLKIMDGRSSRKEFVRYMFHKKKRIQKKWDKKYNDKYKIIKYTPSYISGLCASA